MSTKFYQVDYAQMNGSQIINMGIFNIQSESEISKERIREQARQVLNEPDAIIVISNITKLTRAEFELSTDKISI